MPFPEIGAARSDVKERWLSIIGIGEDGWEGLSSAAKQAVESAEFIYGGVRHLAYIPKVRAVQIAWPSPMAIAVHEILTHHRRRSRVSVLASGDPMLFGVGATLTRELAPAEFVVIPQVSAFSLACARLGWAISETVLLSLVNRPIEQIQRYLHPGQQLILFSEDGTTPATVAKFLTDSGYGSSQFTVFEYLGGSAERRRDDRANIWSVNQCGDLNLIAVVCVADPEAKRLSVVPGLPDDFYVTDGQLTKREVRAATLSRLAPLPGEQLWDIGAGTGTVGIEWMRSHPSCSCIAFEEREDRAARILVNAKRLGVPTLKVIKGSVPSTLDGLQPPDAIFIGGGISGDGLFQACWNKLTKGGRIVANAVTIESEIAVATWQRLYGGELVRILVARAEPVGGVLGWRHLMPITQWSVVKS
ncbi:precorrin-6y C5,15-methyltransferase (decarboxylating) subunit CbiE [Tunturibacter empetritectus]|uniref:Precorrin-6y C5,15-methyltransferase (Decarboxylating) subunit CbiE n=1 Tax=Tunturiibacter empetritectus TaxID=3069691 RepID=A0AAU7ZBQ7_9BACT